jgi:hypothetical protein
MHTANKGSLIPHDGGREDIQAEVWPSLPYEAWKDTYDTVHMWTQIAGKISLALNPPVNHWWHAALHVTPRGLTTRSLPYGTRSFEIQFDFVDHHLTIQTSDGMTRYMAFYPRSVADFYRELNAMLRSLGVEVKINPVQQEVPNPLRCDLDDVHASYDPEYVDRFRRILVQTDTIFKEFRGRFLGKNSPVHFWWGSFDLAVTRFSGRRAPVRAGADHIQREAYSHECSSAGFWPGSGSVLEPAYYAYTVPAPSGFDKAAIRPGSAYYDSDLSEYLLPYEAVRTADHPAGILLDFLQTTYEAGANLGNWDRANLERS